MIDIEKEREWWDDASEATEKALEYLDELEATRKNWKEEYDGRVRLERRNEELHALAFQGRLSFKELFEREEEANEKLRTQLADQRERDIRLMAHGKKAGES